jgi:hypothetical protein
MKHVQNTYFKLNLNQILYERNNNYYSLYHFLLTTSIILHLDDITTTVTLISSDHGYNGKSEALGYTQSEILNL